MAEQRTARSPRGRTRIVQIARELAEARTRHEELERERRKAILSVSDAMFGWWVTSDLRERRWNAAPPPLAVEQVAP